jgi:hypothetical protein
MITETTTKRGLESALQACPVTSAASRPHTVRPRAGAVSPFQGTGLPFAGTGAVMADNAVRTTSYIQLDPTHPGSSRRPPS